MSQIIFDKATLKDVPVLVEYRIRFALELSGEKNQEAIDALKKQMTEYFSKNTETSSIVSYIARLNEKVAGIGSLHLREVPGNFKNPSGKWGYIMNMYTVPECRRMGVCKGILQALVEEGKKLGIGAFELHATQEGELVYKQNGFVLHPEPTYRKYLKSQ